MSILQIKNKNDDIIEKTKYRLDSTYIIDKLLGSGSYGSVYSVISLKNNNSYAIKKIIMRYFKYSDEYRRQIHELNILFFNRNPFLLHGIDLEYKKEDSSLNIITELFVGGNLDNFIRKHRINGKKIPEFFIWKIFLHCCLGLKYLHLNNIIHRDIKPQNILLDHSDIPNRAVICDFGASICLNQQDEFCSTKIGTPYFMSPEANNQTKYNKKTDIWALGCILYEMIVLEKPFTAPNIAVLNYKINRGYYKPINSADSPNYEIWNEIIMRMLEKNPNERSTITSIIETPIIRKKIIEHRITYENHQQLDIPQSLMNRIIPNNASFHKYTLDLYDELNLQKNNTLNDIRIEYVPSPMKMNDGRPHSQIHLLPKIVQKIEPLNLENIKKPFPLRLRSIVSAFSSPKKYNNC